MLDRKYTDSTPTLAVQEQCLPTNFIPFTIFVLYCCIITIFKYSGYSETVKFGVVTGESCIPTTCIAYA
jgi:hypothetical protein